MTVSLAGTGRRGTPDQESAAVSTKVGRWGHLARRLFPLVALVACALLPPTSGRADGGMPLVLKVIPPYEVTIYASNAPLLAGLTIDVSVLINRDPLGELVTDAQVVVQAMPIGRTEPVRSFPATHAQATNKAFYAANVRLPAGHWQFITDLRDGTWTAQIPFQLDVIEPPHHSRFPPRTIAVWLAAALVFGGAVAVAIRGARHRPPSGSIKRQARPAGRIPLAVDVSRAQRRRPRAGAAPPSCRACSGGGG